MNLPIAKAVPPAKLIQKAEAFVKESDEASKLAKGTLAEAENLRLGQFLDVPQPLLRQKVSAAKNLELHEKYPDYIARTRNVIDSPAPGLGAASEDLRPASRLMSGAGRRRWSMLADDAIRSAALTVDRLAADRVLAELSDSVLRELADAARVQMIANSQAYARTLGDMKAVLRKTLKTRNLELRLTTVSTPEGVWWFARRDGGYASDILGEIFVPRTAGVIPLKRPPIPQASQPRWLQPDGTFTTTSPAGASVRRPLNLPAELIDKGPEALVEQMKRAQKGKITGTPEPVFEQPRQRNLSRSEQQVAGSALTDMSKKSLRTPLSKDEAERLIADSVTKLTGSVGKLALRLADKADAVAFDDDAVKLIQAVFGSNYGPPFNQMHAWGPILGDTTAAGMSIGPNWVNHLQLRSIERFLQSGKDANRIPLTVRVATKDLVINNKNHRFFRAAYYEFTLEGEVLRVNLELTREGVATVDTIRGGISSGEKRYRSWDDLPDWFDAPTQ